MMVLGVQRCLAITINCLLLGVLVLVTSSDGLPMQGPGGGGGLDGLGYRDDLPEDTPSIARQLEALGGPGGLLRGSRGGIDSLSGITFGQAKRMDTLRGMSFGGQKRNLDEIDRSGFDSFFRKRNFDEIDRSGFDSFVKRNAALLAHYLRNNHPNNINNNNNPMLYKGDRSSVAAAVEDISEGH